MQQNSVEIVGDTTEQVRQIVTDNNLSTEFYFPTPIFVIQRNEFIPDVLAVAKEQLNNTRPKELDELHPAVMSTDMRGDPRMTNFLEFVGATAWNILESQGYNMQNLNTVFSEVWCQEHHKRSSMEQHVHNDGVQIVGFYFLECPPDSSKLIVHDPRAGKRQLDLPQTDISRVSQASTEINFAPKPGMMVFTNAWLPHSFSRHGSGIPMRFVHFNLKVMPAPVTQAPAQAPEII